MACYTPRWYTRPKTVTHPGTNRARRALTSVMRRTPLVAYRLCPVPWQCQQESTCLLPCRSVLKRRPEPQHEIQRSTSRWKPTTAHTARDTALDVTVETYYYAHSTRYSARRHGGNLLLRTHSTRYSARRHSGNLLLRTQHEIQRL